MEVDVAGQTVFEAAQASNHKNCIEVGFVSSAFHAIEGLKANGAKHEKSKYERRKSHS